jgi:hypothetical protein
LCSNTYTRVFYETSGTTTAAIIITTTATTTDQKEINCTTTITSFGNCESSWTGKDVIPISVTWFYSR